MRERLQVGFGRADITPEEYGSMSGFGTEKYRRCTQVLERVFGTCVAISDQKGKTLLLCTADILHVEATTVLLIARQAITAATGVPAECITISATHNHAGPALYNREDPATERWLQFFGKQMAKAAVEALEDRQDATVCIGSKIVENMTFVRHYITNDGTFAGPNCGSFASGARAHIGTPDEQLQMIRFRRETARDILMINWQSHGTFVGKPEQGLMSADYIGALRNHVEGLTGCKFAFFQGAAGNLVPTSMIPEENLVENDPAAYGRLLAEKIAEGLQELHPVSGGNIRHQQVTYRAPVDHSDDHLAEKANFVRTNYYKLKDTKARKALVAENGFNSVFHCNQIVDRAEEGEYIDMEINALCAGDISFVTAPYEMFCSNGMYIKKNTPFAMTFILGYCNGRNQYIPDEAAFEYDCYEVNARRFPKGIAEDIVRKHVALLKEIKG